MWFKNNIDRHEYPTQLQAHPAKKVKYPIPKIPDDSGKKSGTDWVLPKIIGSGIGYPSGTAYDYDCESQCDVDTVHSKEMYDCMDDNYGDDDDP